MGFQDRVTELEAALRAALAENERLRRRVAELEARLEEALRAGKRQAAPFSQQEPKANPRRPGRKSGGDHGRHGHRAVPTQVDETVLVGLPECCPSCGEGVVFEEQVEQFQEELPEPLPRVRRLVLDVGRCQGCGKRVQARHREQTSDAIGAAGVQMGPRALAMTTLLHHELGLSAGKTARVLENGFGLSLSRGGVVQATSRVGERLQPTYEALVEAVRHRPLVSSDETGWRIGGKPAWVWVHASFDLAVFAIQAGRGYQEAAAILGEGFERVLVRDGWAVYRKFAKARHQTCVAHLLRRCHELLEVARGRAREIPKQVKALLEAGLELRDQRQQLSAPQFAERLLGLETEWDALLCREGVRQAHNRRLLGHLRRERDHLLTFLYLPGVPATNWLAEQAIRPIVVTRKKWGGTRTLAGAVALERTLSAYHTARLQGLDPLLLVADLLKQRAPGILPLRLATAAHG